ncbi:MAG: signal peptidase II [Ignavibacteriaceae bacterium]
MKLIEKYGSRFLIVFIAVIFLVGCDQTTKQAANIHLKDKSHQNIAGIINLHYIENDGGMLSLGSKLPESVKFIIFILVVSVFLLLLLFYIIKNQQLLFLKQIALVLIFSGGAGNLIDRIFNNGNVIDFIRIKLPLIESGVFNIADFYVTIGVLALMLVSLRRKPKTEST